MTRLFLVRHAHRDTSNREDDNGLSDKGRDQAKTLVSLFQKKIDPKGGKKSGSKIVLLSSPKKRCIETLTPFSKKMDVTITIDPNLDEQRSGESSGQFEKRVASFLKFVQDLEREFNSREFDGRGIKDQEVKKKAKSGEGKDLYIFVCSHGDWLPLASQKLVGVGLDMKKAGVAEIEDGRLLGLVQPSDYIS